MKTLFIALGFILAITTSASAEDLGKQISIYSQDGALRFGMQLFHDVDFGVNTTLTVSTADLDPKGCVSSLAYRFYNSLTGTYVSDWAAIEISPSCAALPSTFVIQTEVTDKNLVKNIIKQLPNLKLVLSVNFLGSSYQAARYIEIGGLCATNPSNFVDLSSGQKGCSIQL